MGYRRLRSTLSASVAIYAVVAASASQAQSRTFNVPAQSAVTGVPEFARQGDVQILVSESAVRGKTTKSVQGTLSVERALRRLLEGTGLRISSSDGRTFTLAALSPQATNADNSIPTPEEALKPAEADIVVTGTHVRGAFSASPVFTFKADKLSDQGITDMREVAAAIPQNFTGGQNPGVGNGAESRGSQNGDGSTALNLRGLGPDATLTLLNGHRMAYNENNQSVDLSSIPFAAIDRIEVLPDGASAIYGSDAVGGVANVILKKDFQGLSAQVSIGAATSGGDFDQNYNLVGGSRWASGGFILTGNFDRATAVNAGDRKLTSDMNETLTLYPYLKSYGLLGSAHQDFGSNLTFAVDGLYSHRNSEIDDPYDPSAPLTYYGDRITSSSWSSSIDPSLTLRLGSWTIALNAVYGRNFASTYSSVYIPDSSMIHYRSGFKNYTEAGELSAEGPLVSLPGGDVRIAGGIGARRDHLTSRLNSTIVSGGQDDYYGYAELNIPVFAPAQQVPGVYRLSLDAAFRYEDYSSSGRVGTPKLGISWSPTPDFDLKSSWGKSFKAPTQFQKLYQPLNYVFTGDQVGISPSQTVLETFGGNPDLKPERANSLSATFALHPRIVPHLLLGLTYFRVNYRNRVEMPIVSFSSAYASPLFSRVISSDPSADAVNQALALTDGQVTNFTAVPFDPASVTVLADDRYRNVSREKFHGLDISATYSIPTTTLGTFVLDGDGTYLVSRQALIDGQPAAALAGNVFYPPHWKARGGLTWSISGSTLSIYASYIGSEKDNRFDPAPHVGSLTSLDISYKHHFSLMEGLDAQLSLLNAFNAMPARIASDDTYIQPYDTTNYSAIGRIVRATLAVAF
jgi:outer membrane receptor protein involved in Fe transport